MSIGTVSSAIGAEGLGSTADTDESAEEEDEEDTDSDSDSDDDEAASSEAVAWAAVTSSRSTSRAPPGSTGLARESVEAIARDEKIEKRTDIAGLAIIGGCSRGWGRGSSGAR